MVLLLGVSANIPPFISIIIAGNESPSLLLFTTSYGVNIYSSYSRDPVIIALSSLDSSSLLADIESSIKVAELLEVSSRKSLLVSVIFVSKSGSLIC